MNLRYVVVLLIIILIFSFVVYWFNTSRNPAEELSEKASTTTQYSPSQGDLTSCKLKQQAYCNDWINGQKWNWGDKDPKNCEQFGIYEPSSLEECKRLFGL